MQPRDFHIMDDLRFCGRFVLQWEIIQDNIGIRSPHEISLIDLSGNTFFDSLNRKMMQSLKGESEKEKVTKWEKKSDTPQSWN